MGTGRSSFETAQDRVTKVAEKLLLIGPISPPRGGVATHVERLIRLLRKSGYSCTVLDEARPSKSGVYHLRTMGFSPYLQLVSRHDWIHIHTSNDFVRLAHTIVARLLGKRVLHTFHSGRGNALQRAMLRASSGLGHVRIAVSEAVNEWAGGGSLIIPAFLPPSPEEEVVDPRIVSWISSQKGSGRRVIGFNAFSPVREDGVDLYGIDMVLDLLRQPGFGNYAALICIGGFRKPEDEVYFRTLMTRAEADGLTDRVGAFEQQLPFAGPLKHCDVFVRPTTTDGDAVSVREALWYGVPTVASDASWRPGGVVTFRSRDLKAFAEAVRFADTVGPRPTTGRNFGLDVLEAYAGGQQ